MGQIGCTLLGVGCGPRESALPEIVEEKDRVEKALDMRYSGDYPYICWKLVGSNPDNASDWDNAWHADGASQLIDPALLDQERADDLQYDMCACKARDAYLSGGGQYKGEANSTARYKWTQFKDEAFTSWDFATDCASADIRRNRIKTAYHDYARIVMRHK
tara:strand:+ start:93 stop:575 length:483 start_codon:yes stop_codon:yes gene_type:complete